jgi:hypothetical protein
MWQVQISEGRETVVQVEKKLPKTMGLGVLLLREREVVAWRIHFYNLYTLAFCHGQGQIITPLLTSLGHLQNGQHCRSGLKE